MSSPDANLTFVDVNCGLAAVDPPSMPAEECLLEHRVIRLLSVPMGSTVATFRKLAPECYDEPGDQLVATLFSGPDRLCQTTCRFVGGRAMATHVVDNHDLDTT